MLMDFSEIFKKHFPLSYQVNSIIAETMDCSLKDLTLSLIRNYDGSYDLEDSMLGALIMHVALGNIQGWNIDTLLNKLNWSKEFEYDVKNRLVFNNSSDKRKAEKSFTKSKNEFMDEVRKTHGNTDFQEDDEDIFIPDESEIGRYDYDEFGNIEIGGGFDRHGYDRHGYDSEGYDEYGYSEDD